VCLLANDGLRGDSQSFFIALTVASVAIGITQTKEIRMAIERRATPPATGACSYWLVLVKDAPFIVLFSVSYFILAIVWPGDSNAILLALLAGSGLASLITSRWVRIEQRLHQLRLVIELGSVSWRGWLRDDHVFVVESDGSSRRFDDLARSTTAP